ncbi:MAG: glycosyltransferase family 2 protein [Lentisphaeria bacterium]|nr:glycosyltransferase family 2 protein [Lentisphaeria bacterium]
MESLQKHFEKEKTAVKVSIAIPVYRVERYIERCARSLFEQTMQEGIEFIFVNDCTPDRSIEILRQVLEEYPHRKPWVKIIDHPENCGVGKARRTAIENASGAYIIHCDPDDWVDKDFYEKMYLKAVEEEADVVYAPYMTHYENGKQEVFALPVFTETTHLLQHVLNDRFHWSLISNMFHREIALSKEIDCPDSVCHSEDLLRTGQMLAKCKKCASVTDTCYHYFKGNPSSYTGNFSRKSLDNVLQSIAILENKLPGHYNLDVLKTFSLFLGIIYNLFTRKEFYTRRREISRKRILKSQQSLAIRLVVLSASFSYTLTSRTCNILLKIRKKLRSSKKGRSE